MKQVNIFYAKWRETNHESINHDNIIKTANCAYVSRLDYGEFWSYTFRYLDETEAGQAVEDLRSLFWPASEAKITVEDKSILAPVDDYEDVRDRLLRKFVFLLEEADRQPCRRCGGGCEYHACLGMWIRNGINEYRNLKKETKLI